MSLIKGFFELRDFLKKKTRKYIKILTVLALHKQISVIFIFFCSPLFSMMNMCYFCNREKYLKKTGSHWGKNSTLQIWSTINTKARSFNLRCREERYLRMGGFPRNLSHCIIRASWATSKDGQGLSKAGNHGCPQHAELTPDIIFKAKSIFHLPSCSPPWLWLLHDHPNEGHE